MSHRPRRLAGVIQRELTTLLSRGNLKDPRVSPMTTFSSVELSADLGHATIFYTVLGQPERVEETGRGLVAARPFLTRHLAKVLSIRNVPQLHFSYDVSFDQAEKIESLLASLPELKTGASASEASAKSEIGEGEAPSPDGLGAPDARPSLEAQEDDAER